MGEEKGCEGGGCLRVLFVLDPHRPVRVLLRDDGPGGGRSREVDEISVSTDVRVWGPGPGSGPRGVPTPSQAEVGDIGKSSLWSTPAVRYPFVVVTPHPRRCH